MGGEAALHFAARDDGVPQSSTGSGKGCYSSPPLPTLLGLAVPNKYKQPEEYKQEHR